MFNLPENDCHYFKLAILFSKKFMFRQKPNHYHSDLNLSCKFFITYTSTSRTFELSIS